MQTLYAPWRTEYTGEDRDEKKDEISPDQCVFCTQILANQDEKYWIIKRAEHAVLMLNKYPYNAGHILALPTVHVARLSLLETSAREQLFELVTVGADILQTTLQADGVNIGINLGKSAGAGIPSHLHVHMVPRWVGDSNFMPIIADTKVISFDMHIIYKKLREAFIS